MGAMPGVEPLTTHVVSGVADRVRRAGWSYLFGQEWQRAKFAHWTTQWYPDWLVREKQWAAVQDLARHALSVSPFYRQRLAPFNLGASFTLEAFGRIAPLTRTDLVSSWETIRATAKGGRMLRRQSGASSGASVQIPVDAATYCWYVAGTWRGLRWWDSDFSERGAILLGVGSRWPATVAVRAKDWVMNWLRLPVDHRFHERVPQALDRIAMFGPAFIYGYPSAVERLAREIKARGWHPTGRLKVAVLTGEPVYGFQRRAIEEAFQCPVAEEYGNGELGSIAFQCREGRLHVTAENVFLETIPLEIPVSDGGGHILATQLRNRLFPLIRYEIGDLGVLSSQACSCGRGLPTVQVLGRARDRLIGKTGIVFARRQMEEFFNAIPARLQGRVQVAHATPGHLVLCVERGRESREDLVQATTVGTEIFGADWHVGSVAVDRFERLPSGKLPYFLRLKGHR